ncbi:MAG TPA: histidine kinase N-terminal 7TM domain-containing protein [Spirochaetota bacterium]|nr:histidine kinase N-terminal 7TM domain-containing protein [Spirochaetota bacterium]
MIYIIYSISIILSIAVFLFLVVHSWRHRATQGARAFFAVNLLGAWGAMAEFFSLLAGSDHLAALWFNFRFVTLGFLPIVWLVFTYQYSGKRGLTARRIALLMILPAITQVMVWTSDMHGLWLVRDVGFTVVEGFRIADPSQRVPGIWFIVHSVYGFGSLFVGMYLILRTSIRMMRPFRIQGLLIFSGTLILAVGALVPTAKLIPSLTVNPITQSLALCSIFYFLAIFRYRFLNIVPVARDTVIDSMDDAMLVLSMQNHIVDINPAMRTLLAEVASSRGADLDGAFIGERVEDVMAPFGDLVQRFRRVSSIQSELSLPLGDGLRHFDVRISPLHDRSGAVIARVVLVRDITDRRQAEDEMRLNEARLEALYRLNQGEGATEQELVDRALAEALPLVASDIGRMVVRGADVGDAEHAASCGNPDAIVLDDMDALRQPGKADWWAESAWALAPIIHERGFAMTGGDAAPAPIRVMSVAHVKNGEAVIVLGCAGKPDPYSQLDVHQLTLYLEGVWKIIEKKRVDMALARALENAQAAAKAKSEFLANMSHEIRTPMNPIVGLTHLIQQTELTERQRDYIGKIQDSAQLLLGIINNILDFSKIEAGRLDLEIVDFDLATLLGALSNLFARTVEDKGVEFRMQVDPDVPVCLRGDPLRIQQVLGNLIGNAIKFTERGYVGVRISRLPGPGGPDRAVVRFSVEDTGIGIELDQRERIFKPFTQADASITRRFGGTGLGLAIVRNLVELMGGSIVVESRPGEGSRFSLDVPLGVCAGGVWGDGAIGPIDVTRARIEHRAAVKTDATADRRILLVEDNLINQLVAMEVLKGAGMTVVPTGNGREAIDMLRKSRFDLVLMDLQMPEMDGFEATRIIREDPMLAHIPIVAMTAHAMQRDRDRCLSAGMNDHIAKPIDPPELVAMITKWLPGSVADRGGISPPELSSGTDLPETPHGIDLADGLYRLGGNAALLRSVILDFCAEFEHAADDLARFMEVGDLEAARKLVHAIKGAGGNIGAVALHAAAKDLEASLKAGDAESAAGARASFSSALAEVLKNRELFGRDTSKNDARAVDMTAARSLLETLHEQVSRNSFECVDTFRRLKNAMGTCREDEVERLGAHINGFDFPNARIAIEKLLNDIS